MKKKSLVIVESPAKIKTLRKFLGPQFLFESSIGHIRDLPEKEFGIDIENNFDPHYVTMPEKQQVITKLKKAAKECDTIYLAPDPDREGEAIAWHIMQVLPKNAKIKRVSFNSITKNAVLEALEHPRDIDTALVNAQQARRLLDRIVGYKISPILNKRIQRGRGGGVSAGRVQSVALKLVVDREKEIELFTPIEYWVLTASVKTPEEEKSFTAHLHSVDGKRVEKEEAKSDKTMTLPNKEAADTVLKRMKGVPYKVVRVDKKEKKRNPVPPFITSTLQQEASRHYGFSSARTMNIAQGLYEGIDLGNEGAEGLITYMRTDSVRIVPEALEAARDVINKKWGKEFLPDSPRTYSTKKSAQDAHEAIRPTNPAHTPEDVRKHLTDDQFKLYMLIWKRFIACQMMPAIYDTVSADIEAGVGVLLRATGSTMKFQGFLAVYEEKNDDEEKEGDSRKLPHLSEGLILSLLEANAEQSFTRPPPRFSEASLVKELEKSGIGRPSTYATIMNKIQSREYTVKEGGRLKPTELGQVIAQMLENHFQQIMNVDFTAKMEDNLEMVAENKKEWKALIAEFWEQFFPTLEIAEKEAFVPKIPTDIDCPKCDGKLQKVWFRSKYFYGCANYPDCDYTAPVEEVHFNREDYSAEFNWEQKCPQCEAEMKVRHGRYGAFLGCTRYPDCKGIVNIPKKGETFIPPQEMPQCPAVDCPGHMVARRSRFGKTFYSCSTFPECDVIVNNLDDLFSKYPEHPRTPYKKKTKAKGKGKGATAAPKKKRGASTPTRLSDDLAKFVGVEEMARGDVMKKIWEYIKKHDLQDPKDRRLINPDATLAKIIGTSEQINMFKMTGTINKHIGKKADK